MIFLLDKGSSTPLYKQICRQVTEAVGSGKLKPGDRLPSMNQLAIQLGISRETPKKAYNRLLRDGIVKAQQGKGVFVAGRTERSVIEILVILDKQSVYNQILLQALQENLGGRAHITILLHGQNPDVLEYYLDHHLDRYDYYVISPHFPLDEKAQRRVARLLRRIPNRKLIMLDNWIREVPGNYGVVYQDFRHDAFDALSQARSDIGRRLKVMVMPQSLYGSVIIKSVKEFADKAGVRLEEYRSVPQRLERGDVVLLLNSQLDAGLVELAEKIHQAGLQPGLDVRIISYNEMPINELVLGGLTVMSTDFPAMGRTVAQMILSGKLEKVHNPFRLVRRSTF